MLGTLTFPYPPFADLSDLWQTLLKGFEQDGALQLFEKAGNTVALCMLPQGGVGRIAVVMYTYDGVGTQWCARVHWETGVRGLSHIISGVHTSYDAHNGLIEVHTGAGKFIFRTAVAALAAKQPEELFPGKAEGTYPAFRTVDELQETAKEDGVLSFFQKDNVKIGVRVQTWGGSGWKAVIIYFFDEVGSQWSPRVIWDTGATDVRVTFMQRSGIIDVRSGSGMLIFQANILAFRAVP